MNQANIHHRHSLVVKKHGIIFAAIFVISMFILPVLVAAAEDSPQVESATTPVLRWWKGNLHTHTFWSDGHDYPEMVVEWYKKHGYQFLALSDHNVFLQGQKWVSTSAKDAFKRYLERFGKTWVELREVEGQQQVRLKPLGEFRCLFEEPGRFLLMHAEEITDMKAHLGGINLLEYIPPQGGDTVLDALRNNVNAVLAQREKTGQLMFPHINHPNFQWAITAEEMMQVEGEKFFEVYNGHPRVKNSGSELHASTDRMWDIILTKRLAELNLPVMYGIATDDAHTYLEWEAKVYANPGRGWVMVRAYHLSPESIIKAMEAGDFYSSTGVVVKDIQFDNKNLKLEIEPEEGISYTTQFIGTLKGYDVRSSAVTDADGVGCKYYSTINTYYQVT